MFVLKAVVELLSDVLHIEARPNSPGYIHDRDILRFVECDSDIIQLLDERVARLSDIESLVTAGYGFAIAFDPLPDLLPGSLICINDEMLADGLGDFVIDLGARRTSGIKWQTKATKPRFWATAKRWTALPSTGCRNRLVVVPPQVLAEQSLEIE